MCENGRQFGHSFRSTVPPTPPTKPTPTPATNAMSASTTPPLHILRRILRLIKSPSPSKSSTPVSSSSPVVGATTTAAVSQSSPTLPSSNSTQSPTSTPSSSLSQLHAHIISQYRQSKFLLPPQATQQRKIAHDYFILKQDLMERARLHKLDMGADEKLSPRELTRRSAARAGLQLPEEVG